MLEILSRAPDLLVMEQSYEPGAEGPPPHYHPSQDEHFEVLEVALPLELDPEALAAMLAEVGAEQGVEVTVRALEADVM